MDHTAAIVVGLGNSEFGKRELDWAAREAQSRNRPLHVLRAYHLTQATLPWESSIDRSLAAELHAAAGKRLDSAVAYLTDAWPHVTVQAEAVDGQPSTVLRDAAEVAELTVVGSRQLGALGSATLGSVGAAVTGASIGAVVVVRAAPGDPAEDPRVIVGVDGSEASPAALDFAFDFASRHRRPLRVVHCWRPDLLGEMSWRAAAPVPERAERWLAEAVAGRADTYPDVEVTRIVVRDHAVDGLVSASYSQELLVVGARGRRSRIGALLGSVSQGVLHHATCPVAVIHPR